MLTEQLIDEVTRAAHVNMRENNIIPIIRLVRNLTGSTLKVAKDLVTDQRKALALEEYKLLIEDMRVVKEQVKNAYPKKNMDIVSVLNYAITDMQNTLDTLNED